MTKVLQLAQSKFTPEKLSHEVYVSEKLDGVPIRITIVLDTDDGGPSGVAVTAVRSRQDELIVSANFCVSRLARIMSNACWPSGTYEFVGELTHETYTDFKDISGVVRRQTPQTGLILNLFDFYRHGEDVGFGRRQYALELLLPHNYTEVRRIAQHAIFKHQIVDWFKKHLPKGAEGGIIRDAHEGWFPGKRTWGYQKYLVRPTIDLLWRGYEEAMSKTGVPLGMVGRLNFQYKGTMIGVGPGKLTHAERRAIFRDPDSVSRTVFPDSKVIRPVLACIQYKEDDSYDALREPTFQHWRNDKDEPDA